MHRNLISLLIIFAMSCSTWAQIIPSINSGETKSGKLLSSTIEPGEIDPGESVLRHQCGACHIGSLKTARPEALKIFNFEKPNWAKFLSSSRIDKIIFNLRERKNMTVEEISYLMPRNWTPLPSPPTTREIELVRTFFDQQSAEPVKINDFLNLNTNRPAQPN